MSKRITLFSGYSQKENRVTNYCLLILKMLYEENPKYLGQVLTALIGENVADRVGVSFRQQEKKKSSVPDGLIVQAALTVYLETKNYDWFYDAQVGNHLEGLNREDPGMKVLLAVGKFDVPPAHLHRAPEGQPAGRDRGTTSPSARTQPIENRACD
jgi:hypothetical protein